MNTPTQTKERIREFLRSIATQAVAAQAAVYTMEIEDTFDDLLYDIEHDYIQVSKWAEEIRKAGN